MNKISQKRLKKYSAYRFTACLLAVLMLFSALSTGGITVHAETPVAQIGETTYTSLESAVEAAGKPTEANSVEIELLADTALAKDVTIENYITLDLNGHTLDLGSCDLSLGSSGKVVDSSNGQTGLLTTSDGNFNSSTQMAVYDTTQSGYVVADIKHQEAILSEASTGTFKLVFKPDFGKTANSLLGSSGTEAKVSIQILLSFDGGEDQTFFYDSDMIKDVYDNRGKAFYITVTNFTNVSNVKVTPLIVPSLGTECRGTQHTLTAATVAAESVTLDKSSLELVVDNTATLTATVAPNNATDKTVTWKSSDANVATVENGVVTGVAAGTATITATTSNGKTADCTVTVKSEYDAMVAAYEKAAILKYTTCFDDCSYDTEVHNDKNIPSGEFYYLAKDSAYGGSVEYDFDGVNGYILMKEAYGQRIDVKPKEANAKYVIVESKIRYNTSGIKLEFGLRGVKSNGKASPATLGTIENGTFTTNTGDYSKTITSGEWHTFTYVLDINNKKYDLYIDEVKVTEESQSYSYFRGFQGDDFFRIKAANTSAPATNADIMIDDIKVYGCTTDPTAITTE